ncbi:MAG TPA: T9SS type A sorting domain-containing protein [Chitinophagales bacterium]|nr:T9SS type A sorting domain-containing protein [Chitinophagales bacterium]
MKKFYPLAAIVLLSFGLKAQSLTPTVIASTGGYSYSSSAGVSLSYTVGEMTMVQTFSAGGNILTQGFQQPNDEVLGLIDVAQDNFGSFVVYPNPAVDNFWYGFQLPEAGRVSFVMTDMLGQKISEVYNANYDNGKIVEEANVSTLAAGVYFLTMNFTSAKDGKTHIATKKIQVVR